MNIKHHPRTETLAAYAAGALDEARAVVVATHLELCVVCRRSVRDFEALGGACLELSDAAAMSADALHRFWARAGAAAPAPPPASTRADNDVDPGGVRPLRAYLKGDLDSIDWRPVAPGVSQHVLDAKGYRKGVLRLLKFAPGVRVPKHSHGDEELTLILRGAYADEIGEFRAGDLADLDDGHAHSPLAIGDEPCVCLIATNAPLAFRNMVGRLTQPFIGL